MRSVIPRLLSHVLVLLGQGWLLARFAPFGAATRAEWLLLVAGWLLIALGFERASRFFCRTLPLRARGLMDLLCVIGGAALPWLFGSAGGVGGGMSVLLLAGAVAVQVLRRGFRFAVGRTRQPRIECGRWLLLALVSAWLIHPYATRALVGAGDVRHYAQQLADSATQLRAGVFPIFVGQSGYAYNGDIHPLRTAPYFPYLGGALLLLTGNAFGAAGVQNLLIIGSFFAAVFFCYLGALSLLRRDQAWFALVLALAFASSPGILSLVYCGDMVASWMTLPYLPLAFWAAIRIARDREHAGSAWLTLPVALAAMWLAHAPIAFWTTAMIGAGLGCACTDGRFRRTGWWLAGTAGVAALLCVYVFVSVAALDLPVEPLLVRAVRKGGILVNLQQGWAGFFRPVDATASDLLGNLQLSPALWLAFFAGLFAVARQRVARGLALGAAAFLLLLFPARNVAGRLWGLMPETVIGLTDQWPMQRFYPILTALAVALAALGLGARCWRRPAWHATLLLLLAVGVTLSVADAQKFIARGKTVTEALPLSEKRLRLESAVLSRYSHEMYGPLPRYFTHGSTSSWLASRLLASDSLDVSVSNYTTIVEHRDDRPTTRHQFVPNSLGGAFSPALRLEPGRRYLLLFEFDDGLPNGTLQVVGRTMYREYFLPSAGELKAFGAGPEQRRGFIVRTTDKLPDEVAVNFFGAPESARILKSLQKIELDESALPLQVESLMPYRVQVGTSRTGWLETPKLFVPGYAAKLDGASVAVARSPDGLVMVPVGPGRHVIELNYSGSLWLRAAFWCTLCGWLGAMVYLALGRARPSFAVWLPRWGRAVTASAVVGAIAIFSVGALRPENRSEPRTPRGLVQLRLPPSVPRTAETLVTRHVAGDTLELFAFYYDHAHVQLGFARNGHAFLTSEPLPVNYLLPHDLDITWGMPTSDRVHRRFRLTLNHRLVFDELMPLALDRITGDIRANAAIPPIAPRFSGEILSRQPLNISNLPPEQHGGATLARTALAR